MYDARCMNCGSPGYMDLCPDCNERFEEERENEIREKYTISDADINQHEPEGEDDSWRDRMDIVSFGRH